MHNTLHTPARELVINYTLYFCHYLKSITVKRPVLFIGYEPSIRGEICEFLKEHNGDAIFTDNDEETLKVMNTGSFETVVLKLQRLEDAAILRYINMHFKKTHVLVMPGRQLHDAIPALTTGHYDLLEEPFTLEELKKFI
jgi:DNA-binding NtrC family response regulator